MHELNPEYKEVRSAIKKNRGAGVFGGKYSFSPYMGCSHSCRYCDGLDERYRVEGNFIKDIVVRKNIPDLFANEITKLREDGIISISSGISDAYQHIEKTEMLTRRCAEIILENNFPASVMTKSSLVMRDIDIWSDVVKKRGFNLFVSLTYKDDKYRKIFEPTASSVEERLEVLREFKKIGAGVHVLAMPFMPYITDTEENIRGLYESLSEIGIDSIWPDGLTIKPGRQREFYFEIIREYFPHLENKISAIYKTENNMYGMPDKRYQSRAYERYYKVHNEFAISDVCPHHTYKNQCQVYDEILILLRDMIKLYHYKEIDTFRLKTARKLYSNWVKEKKQYVARRRNLKYNSIDIQIKEMLGNGEFADLIKNEKLTEFLKSVILKNKIFDYHKLRLI